jgi:hypothetical protein
LRASRDVHDGGVAGVDLHRAIGRSDALELRDVAHLQHVAPAPARIGALSGREQHGRRLRQREIVQPMQRACAVAGARHRRQRARRGPAQQHRQMQAGEVQPGRQIQQYQFAVAQAAPLQGVRVGPGEQP